MSPQSNSTPIPWYWNIACASIAGSTAEVIYIFLKLFLIAHLFSYSPFPSIQLKYVFKFKVNKKLYKGMPIKQNTMECSTH